jgi:folate-dependent phosphoribosylglycinamide formyltransferase PurN
VNDLVILAGENPWTWVLANALRRRFGYVPVVLEHPHSRAVLLRRRIRRLGLATVAGQVAYGLAAKAIRPLYRRQEQKLLTEHGLDPTPITSDLIRVSSVNDDQAIATLRTLGPKVIVVSQTRIVARRVLESVPGTVINIHTGIIPQYRGLHGAYWALINDDPEKCGVSVHVVEAGVDTGPIIAQARIAPSASDSYFTHHWLQLAAALPLLIKAIEDALSGRLLTKPASAGAVSRQCYHPTIWGYLWSGLRRGVW